MLMGRQQSGHEVFAFNAKRHGAIFIGYLFCSSPCFAAHVYKFSLAIFQVLFIYKVMRFLCLDFETNGFFDPMTYVLPWTSYPIQISITAVEDGVVTHLYDSLISGAESLATWVVRNVPIQIADLREAP